MPHVIYPGRPKILLFIGTTDTGKSYAAAKYVMLSDRPVKIILHGEWDVSYIRQLSKPYLLLVSSPYRGLPDLSKMPSKTVFVNAIGLHGEEMAQFLTDISKQAHRGNMLLCVDEAHLYLRKWQVPSELVSTIRDARHIGLDVCVVTHRLTDVDPDIRVVFTDLFIFRTHDRLNLESLKGLFVSEQEVEQILKLPRWHFLHIEQKTGSVKLCDPV